MLAGVGSCWQTSREFWETAADEATIWHLYEGHFIKANKNIVPHMARDSCNRYLTIVATARNDDHGGNLLYRMQLFVNGLLAQCKRFNLNAELVLVEWNPPPDKPRLAKTLRWPAEPGPCSIRIIEVPPEIHQQFKYSDRLPLLQMIAKNVGIRRARGRFVLATNIDILFSNELMGFLASGRLKNGYMYRVDRYDVPADVPFNATTDEQLKFCRHNVLRVHQRDASINLVTGYIHQIYPPISLRNGILEQIWKWIHPERPRRCRIHTNGSGDFTLMARDHWFSLRGYPELEVVSTHVDSVLCHMAHNGPAREHVLREPMVIYHIEHERKSGDTSRMPWEPLEREQIPQKDTCRGIQEGLEATPKLDNSQVEAWAIQMHRECKPLIFNDEDWGLAKDTLPERNPC